jgi:predicted dehydrogenase
MHKVTMLGTGLIGMFYTMLNALDGGKEPMETFYDGYVVNAIMDACYRSAKTKKWEKIELHFRSGLQRRWAGGN